MSNQDTTFDKNNPLLLDLANRIRRGVSLEDGFQAVILRDLSLINTEVTIEELRDLLKENVAAPSDMSDLFTQLTALEDLGAVKVFRKGDKAVSVAITEEMVKLSVSLDQNERLRAEETKLSIKNLADRVRSPEAVQLATEVLSKPKNNGSISMNVMLALMFNVDSDHRCLRYHIGDIRQWFVPHDVSFTLKTLMDWNLVKKTESGNVDYYEITPEFHCLLLEVASSMGPEETRTYVPGVNTGTPVPRNPHPKKLIWNPMDERIRTVVSSILGESRTDEGIWLAVCRCLFEQILYPKTVSSHLSGRFTHDFVMDAVQEMVKAGVIEEKHEPDGMVLRLSDAMYQEINQEVNRDVKGIANLIGTPQPFVMNIGDAKVMTKPPAEAEKINLSLFSVQILLMGKSISAGMARRTYSFLKKFVEMIDANGGEALWEEGELMVQFNGNKFNYQQAKTLIEHIEHFELDFGAD